ncbi:winged helix-turn-helix transcriptional regulator [Mycoplasmatota bacterium]|nr:winged helix-turn-helix transcriptional regulator [Mycoplasmatota bacterium]
MFIKRSNVRIKIQEYATMEIFMGFVAIQNPGIFPSDCDYLKYHKEYKINNSDVLKYAFPEEDLDSIEEQIEPIIKIFLEHGDIVLNDKDLNEINTSNQIKSIMEIARSVWELGFSKYWTKIKKRYDRWDNVEINNIDQVIRFLEGQCKQKISLEHQLIIENAKSIILIPLLFLDTQLGFNNVNDNLIILFGTRNIRDNLSAYENNDLYVRCLAALGEKNRLAIMKKLLLNGGSIEGIELASQLNITPATVSHHFTILRQAGLVSRSKSGRIVRFSPEISRLQELVFFLNSMNKGENNV